MKALTPRQLEIVSLIAEGHTNQQIANILQVKVSTIRTQVSNIIRKTHCSNRVQLVSKWMRGEFTDIPRTCHVWIPCPAPVVQIVTLDGVGTVGYCQHHSKDLTNK